VVVLPILSWKNVIMTMMKIDEDYYTTGIMNLDYTSKLKAFPRSH
jgi:hypothetical protein